MTSYVLCKSWLCSRSQPGIKVIIRDLRGHLLHTVTFLVTFGSQHHHLFRIFEAFDKVWHAALWATMRNYNISANLYDSAISAVQMNRGTGDQENGSE